MKPWKIPFRRPRPQPNAITGEELQEVFDTVRQDILGETQALQQRASALGETALTDPEDPCADERELAHLQGKSEGFKEVAHKIADVLETKR